MVSDEELRLKSHVEDCHAEALQMAAEISKPRRSLLLPEYLEMQESLERIESRRRSALLALREYRKAGGGRQDKFKLGMSSHEYGR
jgi:hypothetical protein